MSDTRFRAYDAAGDVIATGDADGLTATFTTETEVDRVVFYGGPQETEYVLGTVQVGGQSGDQTHELVLPE